MSSALTIMLSSVVTGGLDVQLSEDEIKYLEEPYKPMAVIGHS